MKKLFIIFVGLMCLVLFTSCYSYVKAEKLVYSGAIAKKPAIVVKEDTITTTYATE